MLRTLICDDEVTIRNGLSNYINNLNLPLEIIALAENGNDAISLVEKYHPELIFMDINMPHLDGLSAIKRIMNIKSDTVIIIISGHADFDYAKKAIDLGVFKYLLKPLNLSELKSIIESAIIKYNTSFNHNIVLSNELDYISFIKKNFNNSNLTLNYLSIYFQTNPSKLSKEIKEITSMNFTDYLNSLRITYAKKLLLSNIDYTIYEISELCGYSSQHYFSRCFKNYTGTSPLNFKKN